MGMIGRLVHWETQQGIPIERGQLTITPIAQRLGIQTAFGGFHWNRPVAVQVEGPEGSQRIPIVDVTRVVQLGLLAAGLALFLWTRLKPKKEARS